DFHLRVVAGPVDADEGPIVLHKRRFDPRPADCQASKRLSLSLLEAESRAKKKGRRVHRLLNEPNRRRHCRLYLLFLTLAAMSSSPEEEYLQFLADKREAEEAATVAMIMAVAKISSVIASLTDSSAGLLRKRKAFERTFVLRLSRSPTVIVGM
ncbi:hypothetical protein THAOC_29554, partial [Thalassiosira oceanica]